MRYLKKFEDVNNQPSDYEELVSIVRSYMDNQALDIIQEEAMKVPDNYYINVRLVLHFTCDEKTFKEHEGWIMPDKYLNDDEVIATKNAGDIKFSNKGIEFELIGTNVRPERVSTFGPLISKTLYYYQLIQQFDPKMGYTISVGYRRGSSDYVDIKLTKEIGEKAFGDKYSRYKGDYNPQMVHEWR